MKHLIQLLMLAAFSFLTLSGQAQNAPALADAKPVAPPARTGGAVAPPDVAQTVPVPAAPLVAPAPALVAEPAAPPAGTNTTAEPAPPPAGTNAAPVSPAAEIVPLIVIDDVPLLDAVKNLARQAALNFQFDPRVIAMTNQPNVTIRFENVTSEDALSAVLDNYGLALAQDVRTKIYKITIKDPKAKEPLVSRVIQLKYAAPSNIVQIVKSTLSLDSQVLPDSRTSQMVVMTTEKELIGLELLVEKLDTPTKQVLIEAQLWETSKNPQTMKGIDWSGTLESQRISFGNGTTTGEETITSPGASSTVTLPGGRTVTTTRPSSATRNLITDIGSGGLGLNTAMGMHPATAFLNSDGLHAVLSFLNKDSDTELVATPRAVTLDNQLANLNVSRAYPVYKITPGSANSPAGSEITWTNVGVILQVTPRISANSNIALHVIPEVSDIAAIDRQVINGQTYTANIYGIRKVETHVMIPSGATLVMGGLLNDRSFKGFTKVPVLGDLPGVGLLFRKEEKKRDKNNLMIFVTPTIIEDGDFQSNKGSGFLKAAFKPENSEKPWGPWDSGKPKDWTVPPYNPDGPKAGDFKGAGTH
ncbi:MAG: hypothetical protein HZA90_10200 [Verrucomicrobia bacterium]|nr:hypothetical protein [Verrucomicrobiota bacterium]